MAEYRIINLTNGVTIENVSKHVQLFLEEQKGLISEDLKTNEGFLIQAKAKNNLKKFVGMDMAIHVQLSQIDNHSLGVNIGSGNWIDKIAAGTIGAFVFWPLFATSAVGAWGQKKLPSEIFDFIYRYIASGGKVTK